MRVVKKIKLLPLDEEFLSLLKLVGGQFQRTLWGKKMAVQTDEEFDGVWNKRGTQSGVPLLEFLQPFVSQPPRVPFLLYKGRVGPRINSAPSKRMPLIPTPPHTPVV